MKSFLRLYLTSQSSLIQNFLNFSSSNLLIHKRQRNFWFNLRTDFYLQHYTAYCGFASTVYLTLLFLQ